MSVLVWEALEALEVLEVLEALEALEALGVLGRREAGVSPRTPLPMRRCCSGSGGRERLRAGARGSVAVALRPAGGRSDRRTAFAAAAAGTHSGLAHPAEPSPDTGPRPDREAVVHRRLRGPKHGGRARQVRPLTGAQVIAANIASSSRPATPPSCGRTRAGGGRGLGIFHSPSGTVHPVPFPRPTKGRLAMRKMVSNGAVTVARSPLTGCAVGRRGLDRHA
jgi:hypothetical protein